MTQIAQHGDRGPNVKRVQDKHREVNPTLPPEYSDSIYGDGTAAQAKQIVGVGDGKRWDTGDEALCDNILIRRQIASLPPAGLIPHNHSFGGTVSGTTGAAVPTK